MKFLAILLALLATPTYAVPLKVVASFSILGDMVHEVAGDNIELKTLVGPNGDSHVYEPTPADAKALSQANLVFVNGLGLESWLGKLIMASGYPGPTIVATRGIDVLLLENTLHEDPHAWQDLGNARIYVANIRDALVSADPAHASAYQSNAATYLQQIDNMDKRAREMIARIPDNKRKIISTHDAFHYFARAYHVNFIAPAGINPESSLTATDIATLEDLIRKKDVQVLFMENISDSRLIRQLEADTGAYVGGTLYSDALSPKDGPAPNYIKMLDYNVEQLAAGMLHNQ